MGYQFLRSYKALGYHNIPKCHMLVHLLEEAKRTGARPKAAKRDGECCKTSA